MQDFRKLQVWEKAHQLTLGVYQGSNGFPQAEIYGLTSQMRRASASIGANIAEGCGRNGGADFARFLQIAMGSASELEYYLLLARDLGFLPLPGYAKLMMSVEEVKKMLAGLIQKLRTEN